MIPRASPIIAIVLFFVAAPVRAQSFTRLYISASVSTVSREFGTSAYRTDGIVGPERGWIPALSISIGARVHRHLGIEGSADLQASQTFPWTWNYRFPQTDRETASDRDTPLLGYFRIFTMPACRRVCVDPVIGLGYTWHHAESLTIETCGTYMSTGPCVAVDDTDPWKADGFELTFATGVDVPVRVSPAFSIAPRFRLLTAARRQLLLNTNHAPDSASGIVVTIGLAATWSRR